MSAPQSYQLINRYSYYEDHYPGILTYQRVFCELCISMGMPNLIETSLINPMTVRLISAKRELDTISLEYAKFDSVQNNLSSLNPSDISIKYDQSRSSGSTLLTPELRTRIELDSTHSYWSILNESNDAEYVYRSAEYSISMFEIHKSFYNLSYHISSIMDRIKTEIDIIYGLQPVDRKRLYLLSLIDQPNIYTLCKPAGLNIINQIKSLLNHGCNIRRINKYRNTIAHKGFISIQEEPINKTLLLQDDPDKNPTYSQRIDVKTYANSVLRDIVALVDKFYELIYIDVASGVVNP